MKKVLMGLVLVLGISSAYGQEITVRSMEAEDVDYSKYNNFNWASHVSNDLEAGIYFLNDLILKAQVREAVKGELMGLGYELNEGEDADLLVNFRVFDQPITLKGQEGYGDDYWGPTAYTNLSEGETVYEVEAGTLLLSLADRESGKVIWQGFASGLLDNDKFIKDEVKIREAVNLIFEDYSKRAKEYTRK